VVESKEGTRNGESATGKKHSPRPGPTEDPEQLVLTLGGSGGEIVKVERMDKAGQRRELSEAEFAELAGGEELDNLEAALEEAFGAGILAVLGEEDEDENEEEAALRRLLLAQLLGRRMVRPVLRRLLLRRALRRRLIERRAER
jgi:hypothetical protein